MHVRGTDDGGQSHDRGGGGAHGITDPGDAEDRADRHDRVGRRQHHEVGVRDGVEHAGAGRGGVLAHGEDRLRGHLGAQPHPVLLEVHDAAPADAVGVRDRDVRLDPVVAHRQQPDPVAVERLEPAAAQRLGDLREAEAGLEHLGAHEVGGDVAVAEAEPRRLHAVRLQLGLRAPRLLAAAPAALDVDPLPEGVHHGVEVGADLQPVDPPVVGGVGHDGDVRVGGPAGHGAGAQAVEQALDEPRPTDTSREDGDTTERCGSRGR